MVERRGRFRLKVVWVFAGLADFTTDQAVFCVVTQGGLRCCKHGIWQALSLLPLVVRSRLSLNCRMHFTAQQKCLGFMMCGVVFYH